MAAGRGRAAVAAASMVVMAAGSAGSQGTIEIQRLYQATIPGLQAVEAAPVRVRVHGNEVVVVASTNGTVVAIDAATGSENWRVELPTPSGGVPVLFATPGRIGKYLFVAYAASEGGVRQQHLVSVVDLRAGELAPGFPTLELKATKPANGGGTVVFNPPTALARAALVNAGRGDDTLGMLYVSFGNARDIQPWHGWIFEMDIDAWERDGPEAAISSVLLTTPESECPIEGQTGSRDMICGAGVWHFAGPWVVQTEDGYELLVTTGNGELNLNDRNYANTVLRLSKGLDFDPACNPEKCADFDPASPSEQCMRSCGNLAIPRLLPDEPPLQVGSGLCDGKTFLECYALNDWDLGANGAVQLELGPTVEVIVQPGKDGALYLFDATKMGRVYDRDPIIGHCDVPDEACPSNWAPGMIRAQPVVAKVDGQQVVIVPTFTQDDAEPAGVVARQVLNDDDGPHFAPLWEAPPSDSQEALDRFRSAPSLAVLTKAPDQERYVWVVDTTGEDTLLGIRVSDGSIVARQQLQGQMDTVRPLHHHGVIYIPSRLAGSSDGEVVLEAFRIQY